ncbi:MAG: hypothetical protein AMJ60_11850 [Desulfobacterales bacterium SG8_35]|nr:MAG: hypothetical protein AMJ60_11850 [Desulfobacterales bacterium SG8_35]
MKGERHKVADISVKIFQTMNRLRAQGHDLNKLFRDVIDRIDAGHKIDDALGLFFLEAQKQKEQQ